MTNRRDFLKAGAAAGALALASPTLSRADALAHRIAPASEPPAMDPATKELLVEALNAAKMGGASFADARIGRYRNNFVVTREKQIVNVVDTDTLGVGVRVLVNGTWGFGASRDLTKAGVVAATKEALAIAKANALPAADRVRLAPATPTPDGRYVTPHTVDPFSVPIEQKADLLIRANTEAMKVNGVRFVNSNMFFVKEEKNYANTEGTFTTQTVIRSWMPFAATAIKADGSDFQTRTNVIQPAARGYEYLTDAKPVENARRWGEEAAEKLLAKPVEVGRYDLVLHPSHLWLTIHESIAHPTELDRAMGYEANYAGTSFLAPPREKLGKFKYGPSFMNIQGNRSEVGGCSTIGWDDDGVKPDEFLIVKNGMLNDYQTTREQAPMLDWWYQAEKRPVRSHGCSHGDNWSSVQFQRMPNISQLPGERDTTYEDIIAATDRGIAIIGDGSFSIDQQRYNAQFGGQLFYEIKGGKIVGQLKDVAYQMRTPEFWNSMDMIGGKRSYEMGASFFDGKGQPGQVNAVSHGCVPSRFRNVNVINTGEKGMSAPKSLFDAGSILSPSEMMSRSEAQAFLERVVKLSKADTISAQIGGGYTGNIRFAANRISTSGGVSNSQLAVQSGYGPKNAVVTTGDLSPAGIERAVRQSEAIAKLAPDNPEVMPLLPPQQYTEVKSHFDSTANLTPMDRAAAAHTALDAAKAAGDLAAAGFITAGSGFNAIASNTGMYAYHAATNANYQLTVRTSDGTGSGWAAADHPDWRQIDFKAVSDRAIQKARASRNPVAVEPGRYTVILEPQAVGDLVQLLAFALDARSADEGRSAFTKQGGGTKIGEKIVDSRVTLFSDPADPQLLGQPFTGEGLPLGREVWIENGVLKQLAYSRFWAQKKGARPNGGLGAVKMVGGDATTEQMIASTPRGILVTRLWYLRQVDPRTVLYTGLTRDGTFLIENGKVTKAVKNLRFNESPLFMLNNLEMVGHAVRVAGTEAGGNVVFPTLKVKDFNFTSLSDAV